MWCVWLKTDLCLEKYCSRKVREHLLDKQCSVDLRRVLGDNDTLLYTHVVSGVLLVAL
jgi:hypothetical protein